MSLTYDNYRLIFIVAAILCGIMLVTSILLFILLRIPKVIGDLSGATAKKAIENIRNQNEASGDKTYKTSAVNQSRGKITDKISPSGRLQRNPSGPIAGAMATEKIGDAQPPAAETAVLAEPTAAETTILGGNDTTVLSGVVGNETVVLSTAPVAAQVPVAFAVEYEITYIHTNEIIPAEVF